MGWNNSLCQFISSGNGSSRGLICDVCEYLAACNPGGVSYEYIFQSFCRKQLHIKALTMYSKLHSRQNLLSIMR